MVAVLLPGMADLDNKDEKKEKSGKQTVTGERRWYAVQTYSGYEDAVAGYLRQRIDSLGLTDRIFNIMVPKEKKIKIKNGKRHEIEEKIYPGYVLVEMVLTDDTWYVVRNTPRVTRFVGSTPTSPRPILQNEMELLIAKMGGQDKKFAVDLAVGDVVKITDGPFKDQEAKVSQVDEKNGTVKVTIAIFGRDTTLELDSLQVQKL